MPKARRWPEHAGDKENSPFFEEYLQKMYDRREQSGIEDLVSNIRGIVIQVPAGKGVQYAAELTLMTPYRFLERCQTDTHNVYVLNITEKNPMMFVLEPLTDSYIDDFTEINYLYARAREQVNTRYLGEIYATKDMKQTREILESQEMRFMNAPKNAFLANTHFAVTQFSPYTQNIILYAENNPADYASLSIGKSSELTKEEQALLDEAAAAQDKLGIDKLLHSIDHIATRVLSQNREHAMLEFLSMTSYEFWGAFDISQMNSSTNVCRNPAVQDELLSPAKVFTANNTPYYVNSIDEHPSPTEDFVRNFGARMHHIAYAVEDGEINGMKNVEHVVDQLMTLDVKFLARIFGECGDEPDLKQIFSRMSQHSFLITEYIQRCHGFQGFFTKENVGKLTEAAGLEEQLRKQEEGERMSAERGVND